MSFARTKIQPPRPRGDTQIERPALEGELALAFEQARLVLVAAPAGFGKTTALARAAARLPAGHAFGWIACDAEDTPLELLECLLAVLEPWDPPWRIAPEALLRLAAEATDEPRLRQLVAEVVNAVDACAVPHGTVVVDDLHRIAHGPVHAFLDALVERLPVRWTLVLASRTEPPLALARWRAAGELAEFRADELRFADDEVQRLAQRHGLAAEAAAALQARTGGWPAGVRLALAAPAAGAVDRHVFDFLTSEVIDRLPAADRDFLLVTSVLPELTPARAAALTGDAQAALRLDALVRDGLFVTMLDEQQPTLRLHDLFRGVLETRFARERPAQWREALRRAAASEPDALRRVAWLQRAEAWDEAEDLLAEVAEEQTATGAAGAVRRLFDAFPAPRRDHSARLKMLLARTAWDWDVAVETTAEAAAGLAAEGRHAEHLRALSFHALALAGACRRGALEPVAWRLLSEPALEPAARARTLAALSWTEISRGDQRQVAPLLAQLLDVLEGGATAAQWLECTPLGPYVGLPGMRPVLERAVRGALQHLPERPSPLRGVVLILQGWLALWRGDVPAAEAAAEAAASESRWLAHPVMLDAPSRALQAVLQALRGEPDVVARTLQPLIDAIDASGIALHVEAYLPLYLQLAMRCAALVDDRAALQATAARLAAVPEASRSFVSPAMRVAAQAHLASLAGDTAQATALRRALLAEAHRSDLYGQVADTRLRLADTLLPRAPADAAAALAPLFDTVDAHGEWGAALLAGPALLARLAAADWRGALPAARQAELRRWAAEAAAVQQAAPAPAAPADSGLSARELEVLERMAAGDSNKLIARALDLSPHTVKRHVANILDKLGLHSRAQAAAWYGGRHP